MNHLKRCGSPSGLFRTNLCRKWVTLNKVQKMGHSCKRNSMDHLIGGGALPEVLFSGVLILPKQACKLKVQKHWNTDHEWEKTGGEYWIGWARFRPWKTCGATGSWDRWRAGGCNEDRGPGWGHCCRQADTRQKRDLGNYQLPFWGPVINFLYHSKCIKSDSSGIVFVINIDKTGNFIHLISIKVFEDDAMTF